MKGATGSISLSFTTALFALLVPSALAASPTITSTSFSHITSNSAQLEAEVNPEGRATLYRFEYGSSDCSAEPDPCTTLPSLEGTLSSGANFPEPLPPAQLSGLVPGATYHFRLIAESSKGVTKGPDRTFTTYLPQPASPQCSNDAVFREGKPSALLPDCRAYEQASAVDKNGADANGAPDQVQTSTDGDAITFFSPAGLPGAIGAQEFETYLARRGPDGWLSQGVYPPASAGPVARNAGWTPDLSQFFSNVGDSFNGPWVFRLRSSADESFSPVASGGEKESFLAGASTDGSVVYFQSESQLLPQAIAGKLNLYAWDRVTKALSLAGVLADSACGSPPCVPPGGSFAGPYAWFEGESHASKAGPRYYVQGEHAVSNDGSKVYFTSEGQIYLREGATGSTPKTAQVSASRRTPADPNGGRPAAFMAATPDGSHAFFTSAEKLTDNATTGPEITAPPTIARAGIDGSSTNPSFLPARAQGLFANGGYLYWANPVAGTIGRAKLGASGPEEEDDNFIAGAQSPRSITVGGEYVYWTDPAGEKEGEGWVGRAKIGPTEAEAVEPHFMPAWLNHLDAVHPDESKLFNPRGITVDENHIYWGDVGSDGSNDYHSTALLRANLNGGEIEEYGEFENTPGQGDYQPRHLAPQALAVEGSSIYAVQHRDGSDFSGILRLSLLDQRAPATAITLEEGAIRGVATDASHLYWTNSTTSAIGLSNLDLSEPKPDFITGAGHPLGLAADSEHLYWSANQEVPPNPGNDLYRFDAGSGELTDLTVDTKDVNGAEVKGVLGVSDDGSDVYFAANGDLDGNGQAVKGDCKAGTGGGGFLDGSGNCSLYLAQGEQITFIAPLGGASDAANWEPQGEPSTQSAVENTARVSGDGQTLLFRSQEQLTDYDNRGTPELYRYHAGEGIFCLSCVPSGAPPLGSPALQSIKPELPLVEPPGSPAILTRNLSADGKRIFFESPDKLVAQDTDGEDGCTRVGQAFVFSCQDVYEWEAEGTGSCESKAQSGGCLYLLSSGSAAEPAFFGDASLSGDDAFIFTREPLVAQDKDQVQDVYDARREGGLAAQNAAPSAICGGIESCRGALASSPGSPEPQSNRFEGPGNPKAKARCPKSKRAVRHGGKSRCVPRKHHKHHKHHKRGRRGKTNGRAGR